MSKKTTYIIIAVLILLGLLGWWFFSHENSTTPSNQQTQTAQNLFPYGQNATSSTNGQTNQNNGGTALVGTTTNQPGTLPALIQITTTPVSGMIFMPESTTSPTRLRYIDRGTGHLYDYSFALASSTEITNTTVPKVYRGFFSGNGGRVYLQTLDASKQIETMSASVSTTTIVDGSLGDIRFLPKGIGSFAANGSSIFYLVSNANGSVGYTSSTSGATASPVFNSALGELSAGWQGKNVTIETKPSAYASGYFFDLNPKTGALSTVLHDAAGLTATENPTGLFAAGSSFSNGSLSSFVYDEKNHAAKSVPLNIIADKCAWSVVDANTLYCAVPGTVSGTFPDDWYQGNTFLAGDDIWKINASTGVTNVVDFLSTRNQNIDVENLVVSPKENWIAFINKEDLTLWALRIAQ